MRTEYEAIWEMLIDIKNSGASDELVQQVFTTVASMQSRYENMKKHNKRMKEALRVKG